jgi:hypothetical protein
MAIEQIIQQANANPNELSDEDIEKGIVDNIEQYRKLIAYWRVYPDKLVDYYLSLGNPYHFQFFFYQRLFLRALFRHRYVYATFVRAWSKSFMSVLAMMLKAILYPNARLFTVAGGKNQSAEILKGKVDELCKLIPALEREIIWDTRGTRARTSQTKDTVIYTFKNGSTLENVAASEKTRGRRFNSGLMEECVGIDQQVLNEIIVPTMNVNRMVNGKADSQEQLNKSQIYVTTAGYKNSFSYEKLIQILCQSVARPNDAIILGGSWRVPVVEGLLDKNFVRDLKMDGTFNEDSFDREYNSIWTGDIESAFFSSERFDRQRKIQLPEWKYSSRTSKEGYYILGVDVGKLGHFRFHVSGIEEETVGGNDLAGGVVGLEGLTEALAFVLGIRQERDIADTVGPGRVVRALVGEYDQAVLIQVVMNAFHAIVHQGHEGGIRVKQGQELEGLFRMLGSGADRHHGALGYGGIHVGFGAGQEIHFHAAAEHVRAVLITEGVNLRANQIGSILLVIGTAIV